jgi:hypothetical protein
VGSIWTDRPLSNNDTRILASSLHNCRIFVTQNGAIGLAPKEACEGDIICVLRGTMSPTILRQRHENCWFLVSGDCNIYGEFGSIEDEDDISVYIYPRRDKEEEFLIR